MSVLVTSIVFRPDVRKWRVTTVKRPWWWPWRESMIVYEGSGTVWYQVEPWGGRCPTWQEAWLVNVVKQAQLYRAP